MSDQEQEQYSTHACPVQGCPVRGLPAGRLLCATHWRALPIDGQLPLWERA